MNRDNLMSFGKGFASLASAIVIVRFFNLKGWRTFNEYKRLKGKTFLITGANSGIGKELTRQIAAAGGNVIMLCRNLEAGKLVLNQLKGGKGASKMGSITLKGMDLNSFASIEKAASELIETVPRIDCLINNAAIMMAPFSLTEDGFESHIQTNHLGHALLTVLLLPKIAATSSAEDPSRVVFVSSTLYKKGTIREEYFKPAAVTPETFHQKVAYSDSKLASLLYARELAAEVKSRNLPVVINSASPGMVYTNLGRHLKMSWYQKLILSPLAALFLRTPSEGAQTLLYAAASAKTDRSHGAFIHTYEEKPIEGKFDTLMSKKVYQMTLEALKKHISLTFLTEIEPSDPYTKSLNYKNQGNEFFKQKKFTEALDCYSKAINCCPTEKTTDLSIFHQNRAAVYEIEKNFEAVIEECSSAIRLNKKYTKALQRRAKAFETLGYLGDALRDITACDILERFQNRTNLMVTERLLKELSKAKAKSYFSARPFTPPTKHFIKNYFSSYFKHPLVKDIDIEELDADKLNSMLEDFKREKETSGGDNNEAKLKLMEGTIEILKGNIKEGEKKLKEILDLQDVDKDHKVNTLIKLGTIRVQTVETGDLESLGEALEFFKQAVEIDPENPDIYIHRAQIHLLLERIDEALNDLVKCCEIAPDFPSGVAQRIYVTYRCAFRAEDHSKVQEAHRDFEEALKKFPKSTEIYSLYAQMLAEQGESSKADKLFLKAIECDPHDANLIVHRGILSMQLHYDSNKAVELLEQALKVDDKCAFAHEMLGTLEVQRGNLTKGIEYFDKALENSTTETDCAHLFSLREAALAQMTAAEAIGVSLSSA